MTTIPLTLLAVINGIAAWSSEGARRPYWLGAAAVIAVERVGTFAYFIPAMVGLAGSELPSPEVESALSRWLLLNHGRPVLTLSGWLLAILDNSSVSVVAVARKKLAVDRLLQRSQLIAKWMVWSPSHGDTAFTVPLFDEFMKAHHAGRRLAGVAGDARSVLHGGAV